MALKGGANVLGVLLFLAVMGVLRLALGLRILLLVLLL